ncbi:putative amp dependent CoA ligase [Pyrenochaeta sp. MPI-SDFR-AT-0127]|nr:putative amp dependent CoA ligase [Pyrenochaeta sp. MPI-SDFR-AT-0127]
MAASQATRSKANGLQPADKFGGLLSDSESIFAHLEKGLQKNPHAPAVICMHQTAGHLSRLLKNDSSPDKSPDLSVKSLTRDYLSITYMELLTTAQRLVIDWTEKGLKPGSTVLFCIQNGGEFCILLWACILMKLTITCMDPSILAADLHRDLRDVLKSLKPSIIVAPDLASTVSVDIAVEELRLARPLGIILDESPSSSQWWPLTTFIDAELSKKDAQLLLDQARNDSPDRIHSILFTSGTSGKPKGCPLRVGGQTHFLKSWSWLLNGKNSCRALQQAHNSRAIATTQILQTWSMGGTVLMPSRSFDIEDTITAIDTFGATFVVLSPAMVHMMDDQIASRPHVNLESVQTIQIGGDAVNKTVLLKCAALFPQALICTHHGMSEGVAAFKWPFFDVPVSNIKFLGETCPIGTVAQGSTVRLWDTKKQSPVTRNGQGEMHIRSSSIIHHYLGGESETSFYNDAEGRWFVTGDTAIMDHNGIVYILGRTKDMITRAGVGIMPGPLESLIEQFLNAQTSVVGIPDTRLGEATYAVVKDVGGKTEGNIIQHINDCLGKQYALDGVLELKQLGMSEFPVNRTCKILRRSVQEAVVQFLGSSTA